MDSLHLLFVCPSSGKHGGVMAQKQLADLVQTKAVFVPAKTPPKLLSRPHDVSRTRLSEDLFPRHMTTLTNVIENWQKAAFRKPGNKKRNARTRIDRFRCAVVTAVCLTAAVRIAISSKKSAIVDCVV